ncbi:hypothetical protein [Microlunatus speluncae]|uniref:hypothetical protein n=1 Tax=Microlunatus speluncae TaxID=2594267 RepID=UPI0012663E33|nr:hypothetical protein [Microlunatus speluncae]
MAEEIDAAATALRARWGAEIAISQVDELGGSGRSAVYRATLTGGDAPAPTVVIKTYPEGSSTWPDEAAAAAYLGPAGGGLAPDLLALDPDRRILVITDLGDHPQLADALLAGDPELAERALLDWADGLGTLLARTFGGRRDYLRRRTDLGLPPSAFDPRTMLSEAWAGLDEVVRARLGLAAPAGFAAELDDALELFDDPEHEVVGPSDLCPDNNLITADGVRFIDLEFAGCSPVFLEVGYVRVPFPTCWCFFEPPSELLTRAEDVIRQRLITARPGLADDAVWRRGMARATALWTVNRAHGLVSRLPELQLQAWQHRGAQLPARDAVAIRLLARATTTIGDELPSCTEFLTAIHRRIVADFPVPDLLPYPAFRT